MSFWYETSLYEKTATSIFCSLMSVGSSSHQFVTNPPLRPDAEMMELLSAADLHLGRLDGAAEVLPNTDLFVAMYVRKEAVLSSQIEGTQVSLMDVFEYEADATRRGLPADVVTHTQVYPGFDNIAARSGLLARLLRGVLYRLEGTWFRTFGLSHFLVLEKEGPLSRGSHG